MKNNDIMNKEIQQIIEVLLSACGDISELLRQGNTQTESAANTASSNSSGEQQKPLDIISNELVKKKLQSCPLIFALSSEEEDNAILVHPEGEYLLSFDPLDGSSNIDVNMCVGTIFSIFKKQPKTEQLNQQFQQKGSQQVAALFALYGPATTAIIGINPLFLNRSKKENLYEVHLENNQWRRIDKAIECPKETQEYAINSANSPIWDVPMQAYINECLKGKEGARGKTYNMRWLGAMVADMYRIFKRGGVFIYSGDSRNPQGKIRLLYEANPMALLMQLAGGESTNGSCSILDIPVTDIHQKTPVMIGSEEEIRRINEHYKSH